MATVEYEPLDGSDIEDSSFSFDTISSWLKDTRSAANAVSGTTVSIIAAQQNVKNAAAVARNNDAINTLIASQSSPNALDQIVAAQEAARRNLATTGSASNPLTSQNSMLLIAVAIVGVFLLTKAH